MLIIVLGLVGCSVRSGGLLEVRYDSGLVSVGWVESAICSPIPAKKLLNLLAISEGFVRMLLSDLILVILVWFWLRLRASLRIFQAFLDPFLLSQVSQQNRIFCFS